MEFHRIMQYWVELQIIAWIYIELNRNTKNVTKYAENAKQLQLRDKIMIDQGNKYGFLGIISILESTQKWNQK